MAAQAAASASPADAAVRPAAGASTSPSKLVGQATQSAVEAPVTAGTSPTSTMHATYPVATRIRIGPVTLVP